MWTGRRWRAAASFALALAMGPRVARAEIGVSLSAASDEVFRGRSLSAGQPVATLDLSYDDARGPYFGAVVSGVETRHEGPQFLLAAQYAGYALHARAGPTIDVGLINRIYASHSSYGRARDFEAYAGLIFRRFSTHAYYAPDYYGQGGPAVYAEAEQQADLPRKCRLSLHLGVLSPPRAARYRDLTRAQYDWRVGLSRPLGRLSLGAALSGAGPSPDYYDRGARARTRLVVSLSRAF